MALLSRWTTRARAGIPAVALTALAAGGAAVPAVVAQPIAASAAAAQKAPPSSQPLLSTVCTSRADFAPVVGQGALCEQNQVWVMRLPDGRRIQVSPPDLAANLVRSAPSANHLPAGAAGAAARSVTLSPTQCAAPGQPRVELYYAHYQGEPDNFTTIAPDVQQQFVSVDRDYMNYDASTFFGVNLHLFVECDGSNQPVVHDIALSTALGASDFSTIVNDMTRAGHCQASQGGGCSAPGPVHYWVYTDGNPEAALGYAGQSSVVGDDSASASNAINSADGYSVNYGYCMFGAAGASTCDAPIDTQMTGFGGQIFAHENGHAMGAVQLSAPNTTGAWHCTDGLDVMCYNDGGPDAAAYSSSLCGSTPNGTARFDCRFTNYFNPSPAPGSYLATHWDIGSTYDRWASFQVAATTTSLGTSTTTPVAGQPLTITATVAVAGGSGTPGGTVSFTDGATPLGSAGVGANGNASITTSALGLGSHSIGAVYSGSAGYAGSSAPVLTVVVGATLPGGRYVAVTPFRVFDSRASSCVQCVAGGAPLGPGSTTTVQISGDPSSNGTVPAAATAVALDLVGTDASTATFLQLRPAGSSGTGSTSTINVRPGLDDANLAIVPLGTGGQVTLYNNLGSVHAALDVEGYFVSQATPAPNGTAGTFHPVTPTRMCDTRAGAGTLCASAFGNPLGPGESRAITLWSAVPGAVPNDGTAAAVAFNLAASGDPVGTYLTAYPPDPTTHTCGGAPDTSNVNVGPGAVRPNRVIVPIDPTTGQVCIFNSAGTADMIVDVNGWFGSGAETPGGALYYATTPLRACDTRTWQPGNECTGQTLGPAQVLSNIRLTSAAAGLPAAPVAAAVNVTATDASEWTYLTVYADNVALPVASDLNAPGGLDTPNLAIVGLGGDGGVDLFNSIGSVDVAIDVEGWFS